MFANYTSEKILQTSYEAKMISSGDNYPTLKISVTNLQYLLVMLHLGKNPPASSAVEVKKLINDNFLIEIEAIAVAN
ncbi:Uncharacterized protein BC067498_02344 [Bacillus cereus]|nr:Uncharacterized protein BC067498_02344 [Bacillus cereus]